MGEVLAKIGKIAQFVVVTALVAAFFVRYGKRISSRLKT